MFNVAVAVSLVVLAITLILWTSPRVCERVLRSDPSYILGPPRAGFEVVAPRPRRGIGIERGIALHLTRVINPPMLGPEKENPNGAPGLNPAFQQWRRSLGVREFEFLGFRLHCGGVINCNVGMPSRFAARLFDAQVPFWFIVVLSSAMPLAWTRHALRQKRRRRRASEGRCPDCGYDLRASAGRCPECGNETSPQAVRGAIA